MRVITTPVGAVSGSKCGHEHDDQPTRSWRSERRPLIRRPCQAVGLGQARHRTPEVVNRAARRRPAATSSSRRAATSSSAAAQALPSAQRHARAAASPTTSGARPGRCTRSACRAPSPPPAARRTPRTRSGTRAPRRRRSDPSRSASVTRPGPDHAGVEPLAARSSLHLGSASPVATDSTRSRSSSRAASISTSSRWSLWGCVIAGYTRTALARGGVGRRSASPRRAPDCGDAVGHDDDPLGSVPNASITVPRTNSRRHGDDPCARRAERGIIRLQVAAPAVEK